MGTTHQTNSQDQYYQRLLSILNKVHHSRSFEDAYPAVEKSILRLFHAERLTIYQRNRASNDIVSRFKTGDDVSEIRVPVSTTSIAGYVAFSRRPLLISNVRDTEELKQLHPNLHFNPAFEEPTDFRSESMLVVPIANNEVLLGVLQIINRSDGTRFSEEDVDRACELASLIGQKFRYDFGCTQSPYEYLIQKGLFKQVDLERISKDKPQVPVTRILTELFKIPKTDIGQSLEAFYQVPFIGYLPDRYFAHPICSKINKAYLKNNNLALLSNGKDDSKVLILIDNPNDAKRIIEVENILGTREALICVGLLEDIHQYLGYMSPDVSDSSNLNSLLDELEVAEASPVDDEQSDDEQISDQDSAIVKLVNRILIDCKRLNASDIHIEPGKGQKPTSVRMRIDGICQEIIQIPASHAKAAISRIKIISRLDISERRLPQDGKFSVRLMGQTLEVRVATIPTVNGEGVVMRLLQTGDPIPFDQLNLAPATQQSIEELLTHPHGIFLVVGPTGSGKTTTLHAVLACLNTPDRKIWTAEDPVEITQPGLQQVQVQPKIGFDFAAALRAFLRADPDVILIGEMRDKETAHAAIEASLTGHLVFSTLHTNSAPETITRLLDLGIDPISFSDALLGILAQRLVRTLCSQCKAPYAAGDEEVEVLKRHYGPLHEKDLQLKPGMTLYKPTGCDACNHTGYKGRTGLHELLISSAPMREMIYQQSSVAAIKQIAIKEGMRTLLQDGIYKVVKGDTDFVQVRKVAVE